MQTETKAAKAIRGLVKAVFIGCYIAFMWASIHHVATFFNNFEESSGDTVGSYLLAGAFDITALVTTIGVMFFRKSMPAWVFWIVWAFIIAIAGYSFFINWEYASHYQNMALVMQPTGATTPVYDRYGILHYVPMMRVNTGLLWVNPVLASGFTIFSLIYSVIAEFFGTKAATMEELLAKEKYLKETANVLDSIAQLEGKRKGKSLIATLKEKAIEGKEAWKEVTRKEETSEESEEPNEQTTDEPDEETGEESTQESNQQLTETLEESEQVQPRKERGNKEENMPMWTSENLPSWLTTGGSTVTLQTVVRETKINLKKLRNRVESKEIRATKNKDIVYKASLVEWMKAQGMIEESSKIVHLDERRNAEETPSNDGRQATEAETKEMLAQEQQSSERMHNLFARASTPRYSDIEVSSSVIPQNGHVS